MENLKKPEWIQQYHKKEFLVRESPPPEETLTDPFLFIEEMI
jgi:hypothetical protein